MAKYLSYDGLGKVWAKIKTQFLSFNGGTLNGPLISPSIRIANTWYGISYGRTQGTPEETILYSGVKWISSSNMPVFHITGWAYGLGCPVELRIGYYIYNNKINTYGATNNGSWNPTIRIFKYTNGDGIDCVAVGFIGRCYFLQLQVDLQDEMGLFHHVLTDSSKWTWNFSAETGIIPDADDGVTCMEVPYKADILAQKWNQITGKPTTLSGYGITDASPSSHTHTWVGDATNKLYPELNNEINFGGSNAGSVIYVGYRAKDSKPVPTQFIFGGSSGSASLSASKFIKSGGTSGQFLKADGSVEEESFSNYIKRKEHANYYPLVGSIYLNGGNPVAKITFPAPVVKTSNAWFMVACEIVLGYSWQNYPNGKIFLQYYFYYNKAEDRFDASNVKGIMIGTDLGTRVSLKYDISDPRVLYIITVNGYTTVAITNLCAGDTSSYHDYMATEFEKTTLDNVPEGLTTIPINTIDSSGSGVKVNNSYIKTDADELGTAEINNICQ